MKRKIEERGMRKKKDKKENERREQEEIARNKK